MNDKHDEPPQVADGYGISVAYACLVDTVRAIQIEVRPDIHQSVVFPQPSTTAVSFCGNDDDQGNRKKANSADDDSSNEEQRQTGVNRSPLHEQIINSSWSGLLTAFCPLIESWYAIKFVCLLLNSVLLYNILYLRFLFILCNISI